MSTAGGTPFPYIPFHNTKGTKAHFLSYYYHLTGYKRAKEVMEEVIAGTVATAAMDPKKLPAWYRRTGGRERIRKQRKRPAAQFTSDRVARANCGFLSGSPVPDPNQRS